MALNIEVAELMKKPGRVYSVAEKTQYNLPMNYVREKVKNTHSDGLVSLKLCECQSRNCANVPHR